HHQLAPGHLEGLLIVRPVLDDAVEVATFCQCMLSHDAYPYVYEINANTASQTSSRKCQYTAHNSMLSRNFSGLRPATIRTLARVRTHNPPSMCSACI